MALTTLTLSIIRLGIVVKGGTHSSGENRLKYQQSRKAWRNSRVPDDCPERGGELSWVATAFSVSPFLARLQENAVIIARTVVSCCILGVLQMAKGDYGMSTAAGSAHNLYEMPSRPARAIERRERDGARTYCAHAH